MTELGYGELFDILAPLASEVEQKKKDYDELKAQLDERVQGYFSSKYGVREGDIVLEVGTGQELKFEKFLVNERRNEDGSKGVLIESIKRRPFIKARAIHPFGLAKTKKYFPPDWVTSEEMVETKKS